jgi:Plasmid pRiA4b ORF-3-like protein
MCNGRSAGSRGRRVAWVRLCRSGVSVCWVPALDREGWQHAGMGRNKNRVVHRCATRKPPVVRVVDVAPPPLEQVRVDEGDLMLDFAGMLDFGGMLGVGGLDQLTAEVAASLVADVAQARSPLAAELVLCDALGEMESGLPVETDEHERREVVTQVLGQVIGHVETHATADALAALRVCSVLGPAGSRGLAAEAAGRLAAAGVQERPWAATVGRPSMLRAWHYGDMYGVQSSVGVLFDYRGREHVVMVLVDHVLGGGVKDCFVAEGRRARDARKSLATAAAGEPDTFFEDIDAARVVDLLRPALDRPPCPVQDDQIEDVPMFRYLLLSRVEELARAAGLPPAEVGEAAEEDSRVAAGAGAADVLQIKVLLRGTRPPVWRRLEVPAAITLARLHAVLQTAFGWDDSHLHGFEYDAGERRRRSIEAPATGRVRLESLAGAVGDTLVYRYDYGDDWNHLIEVEARHAPETDAVYPTCTGGRRAAPPEDCGGVWGYARMLEALADPEHPEHEEMSEWVPGWFDPSAFDPSTLNTALKRFQ